MAQEDAVVASPIEAENTAPPAPASSAPAGNDHKRPRLDLNAEPRKKGRSIFGQVFGTLKKARDEDSKLKTSDAVKKRTEIDNRIMGKITRDQTLVRQQDEAKRDRISANRKEEDLAIKNGIMKHRRTNFPRLAGFLLTTDVIPADYGKDDDPSEPESSPSGTKAMLAHPPPLSHPPPLYFLPAVLTPAQERFLVKQKAAASKIIEEESKEWDEEKKKGLEEVGQLRAKATEALSKSDDVKNQEPSSATEDKMEVEEDKVGDDSGPAATSIEEPAQEVQALPPPPLPITAADMDAEDTIEY